MLRVDDAFVDERERLCGCDTERHASGIVVVRL